MPLLIVKRRLVFPFIHGDFRVCYPRLVRGHCASIHSNHQKCARAESGSKMAMLSRRMIYILGLLHLNRSTQDRHSRVPQGPTCLGRERLECANVMWTDLGGQGQWTLDAV